MDVNWEAQYDTLRSLHLAGNDITEVSPSSLHEASTGLNHPSSAAIQTITRDENLKGSHMSSNTIPGMSHLGNLHQIGKPFNRLQKLLWLDLSNNRIYHITPNFLPRSLITIDLSGNLLATFPHQLFEHLYDLRIISLRDNLLRSVQNKELRQVRMHLEKLDMGQNLIDLLETDCFQTNYSDVHIRALNLEKNYIKELPRAVFKEIGIVHLVLAFNVIERIHLQAFEGIEDTLEYLDLERNYLNTVPGSIRKLQKLKYLYLTSNNICLLQNLPESTEHLRVLSLSGNNFTMIPVVGLKNYTNLSYLNMGYNSITDIPEGIFLVDGWGSNLQTILLRNNKITHLHLGSFAGLDRSK